MANLEAYGQDLPEVPEWLNKGDNAWQLMAATLIGIQSVPGLVILYGSIVKKKWAINSAFMALYAFTSSFIVWVLIGYDLAFGDELFPFWGKGRPAIGRGYLVSQGNLPHRVHYYGSGTFTYPVTKAFVPMATLVHYEFMYAGLAVVLMAGSVLGRMNIRAWMAFVPLWLVFSYTVCAFSLWGGGFLYRWGVIDYAGGYVIHVSSGTAGFVAAYWVGPRLKSDRERFSPNNVMLMLAGAGLLWMGWAGITGGAPYAVDVVSPLAIINTNIAASTSLLVWTSLDVFFFRRPSVIGAVQGMMTGLVCITPGAGLVEGWAAIAMGILAGIVPWFTMMVLHKKSALLEKVDDTLAVFHTHCVAGILGGVLTGILAERELCEMYLPAGTRGLIYGGGVMHVVKQIGGAAFVIVWNIMVTTVLLFLISWFIPLRMTEEELLIGDDAAHGEEAYALWGDGEKYDATRQATSTHPEEAIQEKAVTGARGGTIQL